MNPYAILGINQNATKDEIKRAYREIALSCHPDKLLHITEETEKQKKIEKFKQATISYNELQNNEKHCMDTDDEIDWQNIWNIFFQDSGETKEVIKDVFVDVAKMFINSQVYPKSYYNPSKKNIEHDITLAISYKEILLNTKRKLRLILVGVEEPIFIDIYCGNFPKVIKEYIDDDDVGHDIIINMEIMEHPEYDHIIRGRKIDLITSIDVTLEEYIEGYVRDIDYVDKTKLSVTVPAFQNEFEICNRGLKEGSLVININIKEIEKEAWEKLDNNDRADMIRILKTMHKMI